MFSETPLSSYTRAEIRHLCQTVMGLSPTIHMGDHRLIVHLISVNDFPAHLTIFEHEHAFYEAFITLSGDGKILRAPQQQPIVPGTVLSFGPHERHSWQTLEAHQSFVIWFDIIPAIPLTSPTRWPIRTDLIREVEQLFHEVSEGEAGWNYRAISRLTIILSRILTRAKWTPTDMTSVQDHPERLAQVIDQFLHDNLAQKVTLTDIATHLACSIRRITRDYRRVTGKSIMQRLLELRMAQAASLLEETALPLSAIGDQVGMSEPSYFGHCFRRTYGVSPGSFRNTSSQESV